MVVKGLFYFVVALHMFVVIGNTFAFFIVPFYQPWYVALPICSLVFFLALAKVECPLTRIENILRRRLGKPRIKAFIKHYFVDPYRQWRS